MIPSEGGAGPERRLPPRASTPTRRWTTRARRPLLYGAVALVALALAWTAVSLRSRDQPGAASREEPSPATASASPPTASPLTNPEAKSLEDFRAIFEGLDAIITQAYVERRPDLIDEAFGPQCNSGCLREEQKRVIAEMSTKNAHVEGYRPRLLLIQIIDASFPGVILEGEGTRVASIRVVNEQGPFAFVGADGAVIEQSTGWLPRSTAHLLYFSRETGKWRIFSRDVEGAADDVLGPGWRTSVNGAGSG